MADDKFIEQRVTALETAVRELQIRLSLPTPPANWWELIGPIADREAFEEALAYGRAFRQADRPSDEPNEQP